MKWTTTKPTDIGWYWVKFGSVPACPMLVTQVDHVMVVHARYGIVALRSWPDTEWCRIPEPENEVGAM